MHRVVRSSRSTDAVSTQMSGGFNPGANSFNPNAGSFIPGGAPAFVPGQPYGGPAAYGAQQGQQQQQQQGGNPADYYNQYAGAPYGAPGAGYGACVRSVENSCPGGELTPCHICRWTIRLCPAAGLRSGASWLRRARPFRRSLQQQQQRRRRTRRLPAAAAAAAADSRL
jgi:hypothetical protein